MCKAAGSVLLICTAGCWWNGWSHRLYFRAFATAPTDEDYLLVEEKQKQELRELCDRFETVVFEPLETDEGKIWAFLNDLFPNEQSEAALEALREQIAASCVSLWEEEEPFNPSALTKCIRGLLTEDLLSEEKQEILKHFFLETMLLLQKYPMY